MEDYMLGAVESRFAAIVWENAPIPTKELTKICEEKIYLLTQMSISDRLTLSTDYRRN